MTLVLPLVLPLLVVGHYFEISFLGAALAQKWPFFSFARKIRDSDLRSLIITIRRWKLTNFDLPLFATKLDLNYYRMKPSLHVI